MRCLVSAIADELKNLVSRFGRNPDQNETFWIFPSQDLILATVGVGYLESAVQLSRLREQFPEITELIFSGSAGVYAGADSVKCGELCTCRDTILADAAAESGSSQYAELLNREAIPSTLILNTKLYPATVATLLTLTNEDSQAKILSRNLGAEVENMELYGIARFCREFDIAWNAVLGITNTVGKNGHGEWKRNYRQIASKASDYLYELIVSRR